jgi:hypothetical protein
LLYSWLSSFARLLAHDNQLNKRIFASTNSLVGHCLPDQKLEVIDSARPALPYLRVASAIDGPFGAATAQFHHLGFAGH